MTGHRVIVVGPPDNVVPTRSTFLDYVVRPHQESDDDQVRRMARVATHVLCVVYYGLDGKVTRSWSPDFVIEHEADEPKTWYLRGGGGDLRSHVQFWMHKAHDGDFGYQRKAPSDVPHGAIEAIVRENSELDVETLRDIVREATETECSDSAIESAVHTRLAAIHDPDDSDPLGGPGAFGYLDYLPDAGAE